MSTIQEVIDRASSDPDFLQRLVGDPMGTARAEGLEVSTDEVKAMLGVPGASDQEAVEVLQARLFHSGNSKRVPIGNPPTLTTQSPKQLGALVSSPVKGETRRR